MITHIEGNMASYKRESERQDLFTIPETVQIPEKEPLLSGPLVLSSDSPIMKYFCEINNTDFRPLPGSALKEGVYLD